MFKHFLAFSLAVPLCGYCQSYADSPFYKPVPAVPSTAQVEGWQHGTIRANGILIDLSESVPTSSPDFDEIRGWSVASWVDRKKAPQIFHYYTQYDHLDVTFGYDLLAESVEGTDKIKCTFSVLTDPSEYPWRRNKDIVPVALPGDMTPIMIKSGDVLSFTTLPLGEGKIAVVHYIRLTRIDLTADTTQTQ